MSNASTIRKDNNNFTFCPTKRGRQRKRSAVVFRDTAHLVAEHNAKLCLVTRARKMKIFLIRATS